MKSIGKFRQKVHDAERLRRSSLARASGESRAEMFETTTSCRLRCRLPILGAAFQNVPDDLSVLAIEERAGAGGAGECQLDGVETEQVQQRGVVVKVIDNVFDRVHAKVVGLAVHAAPLDAAPRHPDAE